MKFKILYACGDSHTAGGEAVDDLIWPVQHPGFMRDGEIQDPRVLSKWRRFREHSLERVDPIGIVDLQKRQLEVAWPIRVGENLGIRVVNDSVIGSSMEWVSRQAIEHVSKLSSEIDPREILVVLQPPTWVRLQYYDSGARIWQSFQLADRGHLDRNVYEWHVMNEDDYSLMVRWCTALIGAVSALRFLGTEVRLLNSSAPDMDARMRNHQSVSHLLQAYDSATRDLWLQQGMGDLAASVARPRCPDLHWSREVHALVGDYVSAWVQKNG